MAIVEINWNPTRKDLRVFAVLQLVFFTVVAAIVYHKRGSVALPAGIGVVSAALAVIGCVAPRLVRPVYIAWMLAVAPIGWLVSHVVLALAYFVVFTPVAWIMRLCGKDPLQRRFDPQAGSYWITRTADADTDRYFRQY